MGGYWFSAFRLSVELLRRPGVQHLVGRRIKATNNSKKSSRLIKKFAKVGVI
jgi:hypothetical protein